MVVNYIEKNNIELILGGYAAILVQWRNWTI